MCKKGKPIYLVVATSGRAIAQSLKSDYQSAVVIDGFCDTDTCAASETCQKVARLNYQLDQDEVLQAVKKYNDNSFEGLLFDSALETNPKLLRLILECGVIKNNVVIGNSAKTLINCSSPQTFFLILNEENIPFPEVAFNKTAICDKNWLIKDSMSTGGIEVSNIKEHVLESDTMYFQKKVDGQVISITFIANGFDIYPLGFNTLWTEELSDQHAYIYAGAINQTNLSAEVKNEILKYASILTVKLNLYGLNCIDCIVNQDDVYILEINPRIPATFELYETKSGEILKQHIKACVEATLPHHELTPLLRAHAIVYAPTQIQIPNEMQWPLWTADRPHAGEEINQYGPICSVFAGGKNMAQARDMIHTRKQTILNKILSFNQF